MQYSILTSNFDQNKYKKMNKSSNTILEGNSFEERFIDISDQEIINILKMRKHYQPRAVVAAMAEATKRGIIHSEEDLLGEEFRQTPLPKPSLFPIGNNEKQNIAILKSLCRIIYGISLIPLGLAYLNFNARHYMSASLFVLVFILIITITIRLNRTYRAFLGHILLAFNVPAMGYAIYYLAQKGAPTTMDSVVTVIVILTILYVTLSINFIASKLNRNQEKPTETL